MIRPPAIPGAAIPAIPRASAIPDVPRIAAAVEAMVEAAERSTRETRRPPVRVAAQKDLDRGPDPVISRVMGFCNECGGGGVHEVVCLRCGGTGADTAYARQSEARAAGAAGPDIWERLGAAEYELRALADRIREMRERGGA